MAYDEHDDQRDAEAKRWNEAMASGDEDRIEQTKDEVFTSIFQRIAEQDGVA